MSKRKVEQRFQSTNPHHAPKKRPPLLPNPHSRDISVRENTGMRSYDNHKKKPFHVNRNCKVLPTSDNNEQKRLETTPYISDNQFVQNEAFCSSSIQSYDNQSFEFENHSCISSSKSQSKLQLASDNTDRITAKMLKTQDCVKARTNQNNDITHASKPDQRCHSENGISVSKGVVPSNEQKTQNKSTKVSNAKVEYVVLNPPSSRLRSSNRSYNKSRSIETSYHGHDNIRVDSSRISVENQAVFDAGVSSSLNTSLHQGPSVIHDNDFRYLSSTGSYNSQQISSTNPPIQQMTQFVNPYRCLVTPQYPILNVSTDSSLYLGGNASPMYTFNSLETLPATPDSNNTHFSNLPVNSLEPERSIGTNIEAITQLPKVQNKRERKERPVSSKSHVNPQYLFSIIDDIQDSQKIKSVSNVVREIIRVLPLKRKASISWVDKETILHAVDELSKHLENEVKLQTRRSVLRYGFQAINPNFVPDVTNTRCDIDDEEFANKYKISQGFVRDSSKDSGSDSGLFSSDLAAIQGVVDVFCIVFKLKLGHSSILYNPMHTVNCSSFY